MPEQPDIVDEIKQEVRAALGTRANDQRVDAVTHRIIVMLVRRNLLRFHVTGGPQ